MVRKSFRGVLLCLLTLLPACRDEKPTVSLDEARTITSSMTLRGATGAAAQQSAADIAALLEREKPDPARVAALQAKAGRQEPPAGAAPAELVAFYFERGLAFGELGQNDRRIADLQQAAALSRQYGAGDWSRIQQQLAGAKIRAGQWRDAIALREEEISVMSRDPQRRGRLFSALATLVSLQAVRGNLPEARKRLAELETLLAGVASMKGNGFANYGDSWQTSLDEARATIADQEGRYGEAIAAYDAALAHIEPFIAKAPSLPERPPEGAPEQWRDHLHLKKATALMRQERLAEAEAELRPALLGQLARRGKYADETAEFVRALADILAEQGRMREAETLYLACIDIYEKTGHGPGSAALALLRVSHARNLGLLDRTAEAVAEFERAAADMAADPLFVERHVGASSAYGLALIRAGRTADAVPVMRAGYELKRGTVGADHIDAAYAQGLLGVALAGSGARAEALAAFKTAIPPLIQSRELYTEGAGRGRGARTLRLILESYMAVLADPQSAPLLRGIDIAAETFRAADIAIGSSVQQAISAASARAAARDPDLADLVRRDQDGRQQQDALYAALSELLAAPAGERQDGLINGVKGQIAALDAARRTIRAEIDRRFPAYAELSHPKAAAIADIRAALKPGEALIATYLGEQGVFLWAIPQQGAAAFARSDMTRDEVGNAVRALRKSLTPDAIDQVAFDPVLANRLYAQLLEPVKAGWDQAQALLVVPDKALGQLPFAVLTTAPTPLAKEGAGSLPFSAYRDLPWLIRKVSITQLPAASALTALRSAPPGAAGRKPFIGIGDPIFNQKQLAQAAPETASLRGLGGKTVTFVRRSLPPAAERNIDLLSRLPRLAETADEVKAIALSLHADPQADSILGLHANYEEVMKAPLSDRRVVMFATHGLKAGDIPGLTEPALALSSPRVTGGGGMGLLRMQDVLGLKLDADWVVLSACNTAAPDGEGAEAVSGLGRAFFYAGARAVLVSNWPVETMSAQALTTGTFAHQGDGSAPGRAAALRLAMLDLMDGPGHRDDNGKPDFSYAHPAFWAPFSLVGDGG